VKKKPHSWGRWPRAAHRIRRLRWRHDPLPIGIGDAPVLPVGNGRSYGDVGLNDGGLLLDARGLDRFISFDPDLGLLRAEAGVLLDDVLALVVPAGWFLPVTPGTRFVTLGGAVANDIHGKNHHRAGSFGAHVTALELLRSDGSRIQCSPERRPEFFEATVGGLGLTGVITWVEFRLRPLRTNPDGKLRPDVRMQVETVPFHGLDHFLALSRESDRRWEHTVAWLDLSPGAQETCRGIFFRGNHAGGEPGEPSTERPEWQPGVHHGAELLAEAGLRPARLSVPFVPPVSLINGLSVRAFNRLYLSRERARVGVREVSLAPFFYPLDGVAAWNRIYGPAGFLQWQCVLPAPNAREGLEEILRAMARGGACSFLSVLKVFGDMPPSGVLSFPRQGITLAVDLAHRGVETLAFLDQLDRIVVEAGGALYPAKDARMSPDTFRASFPEWERMLPRIDPAFSSSLWRRVTESGARRGESPVRDTARPARQVPEGLG